MLTIMNPVNVPGFRCYQDEGNRPDATPKQVTGFWVVADTPRLSVDDKGVPNIRMVKYRGAGGSGANFTFGLALKPTDAALKKVAAVLWEQAGHDVPVTAVTFTDGRLKVFLPGDTDQTLADVAIPTDSGECSLDLTLSAEGALLVEQSARGGMPLMVSLDLGFDARLTGAAIACACDGTATVAALRKLASSASPPIAVGRAPDSAAAGSILETLMESGAVKVTVAPTSPACDQDAMFTLSRIGQGEVTRRLVAFLTATPLPADDQPAFTTALAAALAFTLGDGATLRQRILPMGPLAPGLDPSSWIVEVDTDDPFFKDPGKK
jgi:hypothetical protein